MRSRVVAICLVLLLLGAVPAPGATGVSASANPTAGTNLVEGARLAGRVLAMAEGGERLYLGGEFTGIRSMAQAASHRLWRRRPRYALRERCPSARNPYMRRA